MQFASCLCMLCVCHAAQAYIGAASTAAASAISNIISNTYLELVTRASERVWSIRTGICMRAVHVAGNRGVRVASRVVHRFPAPIFPDHNPIRVAAIAVCSRACAIFQAVKGPAPSISVRDRPQTSKAVAVRLGLTLQELEGSFATINITDCYCKNRTRLWCSLESSMRARPRLTQ